MTAALKGGTLSWLVQPFNTEGETPTYDPDNATLLSFRSLGGGAAAPGGPAAGDGAGLAPSIRFLRRSRRTVLDGAASRPGWCARRAAGAADRHARPPGPCAHDEASAAVERARGARARAADAGRPARAAGPHRAPAPDAARHAAVARARRAPQREHAPALCGLTAASSRRSSPAGSSARSRARGVGRGAAARALAVAVGDVRSSTSWARSRSATSRRACRSACRSRRIGGRCSAPGSAARSPRSRRCRSSCSRCSTRDHFGAGRRRTRLASVAGGFLAVAARHQPRPAREAGRMSVAVVARHRACSAASARSRASCSTARSPAASGGSFPCGTLAVNLSGSFLLGVLVGAALGDDALPPRRHRAARRLHHVQHLGARRATASARTASCASGSLNFAVSLVLGVSRRLARPRARSGAVNDDYLKLTIYFGERDRADGRFLADALIDIFARHAAADQPGHARRRGLRRQAPPPHRPAAHALRGPAARRRSPSTRATRIEAALPTSSALRFDGLVTLERARMLTGHSTRSRSPATATRRPS